MKALLTQNPVAISASLDAQRRLLLPKPLGLTAPLLLIELDEVGEPRLGFSNAAAVQKMLCEGLAPKVLRECTSLRPTISNEICVRHSIAPRSKVWLLMMKSWIAIWSEHAWDAEFQQCALAG